MTHPVVHYQFVTGAGIYQAYGESEGMDEGMLRHEPPGQLGEKVPTSGIRIQ